jgi:hypothetical protein
LRKPADLSAQFVAALALLETATQTIASAAYPSCYGMRPIRANVFVNATMPGEVRQKL